MRSSPAGNRTPRGQAVAQSALSGSHHTPRQRPIMREKRALRARIVMRCSGCRQGRRCRSGYGADPVADARDHQQAEGLGNAGHGICQVGAGRGLTVGSGGYELVLAALTEGDGGEEVPGSSRPSHWRGTHGMRIQASSVGGATRLPAAGCEGLPVGCVGAIRGQATAGGHVDCQRR